MVAYIKLLLVLFLLMVSTNSYSHKPYSATLCKNPKYVCYVVKRGDTWSTLFPDSEKQDLVMRINRINLTLKTGMRIAIPNDLQKLNMLDAAPFDKQIPSTGQKSIYVSLKALAFGAYDEQGQLRYWGPVSGGQGWCPDINRGCNTVLGEFTIFQKGGGKCSSTKYPVGKGGAPMPYCMFFHRGFALHGSPIVPGYNASHGCVRLFTHDAKWLNEEFIANEMNIPVHISNN